MDVRIAFAFTVFVALVSWIVGIIKYTTLAKITNKITNNDLKHLTADFKKKEEKDDAFKKEMYTRIESIEKELIRLHARINNFKGK